MEIVLWEINVQNLWYVSIVLQIQPRVEIYFMHIFLFEMNSKYGYGREYYPHYNIQNFHNDPNTPALNIQMWSILWE